MIPGVDISHWQGVVDFSTLVNAGYKFVIAKATDGYGSTDIQFARNRAQAHAHGLIFGSYHFFHPEQDIQAQINHYGAVIGQRQVNELPPALDWETADKGILSKATQKARAFEFVQGVEKISKCGPFIYGSPGFLEAYGDLSEFNKYPLWIAHYGVAHPRVPPAWPTYTIWQYAETNGLDKNQFNGDMATIQKFLIS